MAHVAAGPDPSSWPGLACCTTCSVPARASGASGASARASVRAGPAAASACNRHGGADPQRTCQPGGASPADAGERSRREKDSHQCSICPPQVRPALKTQLSLMAWGAEKFGEEKMVFLFLQVVFVQLPCTEKCLPNAILQGHHCFGMSFTTKNHQGKVHALASTQANKKQTPDPKGLADAAGSLLPSPRQVNEPPPEKRNASERVGETKRNASVKQIKCVDEKKRWRKESTSKFPNALSKTSNFCQQNFATKNFTTQIGP